MAHRYQLDMVIAEIERALDNDTQTPLADVVLAILAVPPCSRESPSTELIHEVTQAVILTVEHVKRAPDTVVQRWSIIERDECAMIVPVEHLTADELAGLIAELRRKGG